MMLCGGSLSDAGKRGGGIQKPVVHGMMRLRGLREANVERCPSRLYIRLPSSSLLF